MSVTRVLPVGDAAATVELGDTLDVATNARVRALDRACRDRPFAGLRETVPTLRSLLVLYDPAAVRFAALAREVAARLEAAAAAPEPSSRHHEVPTVYGGEHGPDLEPLARALALAPAELAARHASREYTALMLGFTPGFAYLGLLPDGLDVPRLATPRERVPAGSVAVAGRQTAIYPSASPGGWQLLGRTSLPLFDPWREEPSLFAPGDRVRFVAVDDLPAPVAPRPPPSSSATPVVEVLEPGLLTTVQDGGRPGYRRCGVSAAGPLDARAHAAANRAVGNDAGAAGLECTVAGPSLLFLAPLRFAVAGADLGAVLERADLGPWPVPPGAAVLARPGNVLRFRRQGDGCRASVAFEGGLDVPAVLGSRATDSRPPFGGGSGRALVAGDRPRRPRAGSSSSESSPWPIVDRVRVHVVLGPQVDRLEPDSLRAFLGTGLARGPHPTVSGCGSRAARDCGTASAPRSCPTAWCRVPFRSRRTAGRS